MTTTTSSGDIVFVDDPAQLPAALARLTGDVVGVDVERADAHNYYRRAALVQVGDADTCLLIDPLALPDLAAVDDALASRLVVLHAVENDLEPLEIVGIRPRSLADTAVAAAVLGLPTGLGPLLETVLGVELSADKERFQRADWEQRPLDDDMAEYAAGDVFSLPSLWEELSRRLDEAGRRDWYEQELVAVIERSREDRRDWTRTKGSGRLSGPARAILRALWHEREAVSKEHDIAPNRLLRDQTLLDLANTPPETPEQLVRRNQRRSGPLRDHAARLFAALQQGVAAEPEPKEAAGRRWDDSDKAAYDAMRRSRAELADELGLDAGVLCPSRPLWAAVAGEPRDPAELAELAGLRPWQADLLADRLFGVYREIKDAAAEGTATEDEPVDADSA
ncbi:MAG: HRDC domain-containing protein [Actinobacteria bacterium]|nr:HRDC domain-containing protein [Actinomycetota bacterium]